VEFGHLITLPEVRQQKIGLALMREAYRYSVANFQSTHIIADLFIDKNDRTEFYRRVGFEPLYGPYRDPRFVNAPESLLMILEIGRLRGLLDKSSGRARELLTYFVT
jgi:predicted GNAT family N-acyltransferase